MSRNKKTRKGGATGASYLASGQNEHKSKSSKAPSGKKRGKGLPSGSRQTATSSASASGRGKRGGPKDPRLGSKRKIALIVKEPVAIAGLRQHRPDNQKKGMTPEQELELLEQDPRLMDLLERLDNEETLSEADQIWLDEKMERHQQLMEELGLLEEDDEEDEFYDDGGLGHYLKD